MDFPDTGNYEDERYKMDHERRGIALIFDHMDFTNTHHEKVLPTRYGTGKDSDALRDLLEDEFGFEVQVYYDQTREKILEILQQTSKMNHSNCDCLVVVVLTHGEENGLYAKDHKYSTTELWEPFFADNCPDLAGKPKLFFIQACRGDAFDHGVHYSDSIMRSSANNVNHNCSIDVSSKTDDQTVISDILIMYATCPGFLSWRSTVSGSTFIQTLCEELRENNDGMDLLTLLTGVSRRVAYEFESITGDAATQNKKQMPSIVSLLRKDLFLTKKIPINNAISEPIPIETKIIEDVSNGALQNPEQKLLNETPESGPICCCFKFPNQN